MPKTYSPAFTQNIVNTGTEFVTTDSIDYKVIASAGTNDSRIVRISISSDDTIGVIAFFALRIDLVDYPIAFVPIPISSGTNGVEDIVEALTATTFLHRQIDNNANPYFEMQAGAKLVMKLDTPVSVNKRLTVLVTQEDY